VKKIKLKLTILKLNKLNNKLKLNLPKSQNYSNQNKIKLKHSDYTFNNMNLMPKFNNS